MTNCVECEYSKALKAELVTKKYNESGLDNVTLHGVEQFRCPNCGATYYGYGDLQQLHDLIANVLVKKSGLLKSSEVQFLRKHLGYSTEIFGKLIGYNPDSIRRLEGGRAPVTPPFDRLVKAVAALRIASRDYDLHDIFLKKFSSTGVRIHFYRKAHNPHWKSDDAA